MIFYWHSSQSTVLGQNVLERSRLSRRSDIGQLKFTRPIPIGASPHGNLLLRILTPRNALIVCGEVWSHAVVDSELVRIECVPYLKVLSLSRMVGSFSDTA